MRNLKRLFAALMLLVWLILPCAAPAQPAEDVLTDGETALHLVYLEELSYKEAARVMKKTPKQLENLVSRGKKAVRELMGEEGI